MDRAETNVLYRGIVPCVERPSRYVDGELNLAGRSFEPGLLNVLLVFPDLYEIGMSYQGMRILYHRLAPLDGVGVELACAPWIDAERLIRESGETLRSLQSGTPARDFDLVGVSMTYELHYTNLLAFLACAGIPLEAAGRGEDDPIVVAGGPCSSNPLPFLAAFDAVFLGDGEESLVEAVLALREMKGARRAHRKEALAGIAGVYVDGVNAGASARTYRLGGSELPIPPIVTSAEIVHERLAVEIQRGCTRGCRYCHAGMINRPRRERGVDDIVAAVREGLDASGWEEVSLLSLSSSDYTCLEELLEKLTPELERRRVSLSLPSLRPETVTERIVAASALVRRSGFTVAPEAGTERLRRVINRGMSDEEILEGCLRILDGGWQNLKLYFMIGLPTETGEDLEGIASLVGRILALPRRSGRFRLSVAVSPFVPKPHTPFQWERMFSLDELRGKEEFLSRRLRDRRVQVSIRDPASSVLEGVMARGDRRLWPVLLDAYRSGCRFDGWHDRLRFDLWLGAFERAGLDIAEYTRGLSVGAPLPWDIFDMRVSRRFLRRERERALAGELTPDCRDGRCAGCGACGERPADAPGSGASTGARRGRTPVEAAARGAVHRGDGGETTGRAPGDLPVVAARAVTPPRGAFRYRFVYEKHGRSRFLSHLETLRILQRALRRTGWPIRFSEGFHPHPRLSLGPSLAVGVEGDGEFFDAEFAEAPACDPDGINRFLPAGIAVREIAGPFPRSAGKLPQRVRFRYRLAFDALAMLLRGAGPPGNGAPDADAWRRLGSSLEDAGRLREIADRFLPDPAGAAAELWRRWIDEDRILSDRRGRERRCGRCVLRTAAGDFPPGLAESGGAPGVPKSGFEASGGAPGVEAARAPVLELETSGDTDGIQNPRELLRETFPEALVPLVAVKRLAIIFGTDNSNAGPLDLVRGRA